jgi:hypothetical protein
VSPKPDTDVHWRHATTFPGRNRLVQSKNFAVRTDPVTLTSAACVIGMTHRMHREGREAVQAHVEVLTETSAPAEVGVQW